jgi:hypothetical protein
MDNIFSKGDKYVHFKEDGTIVTGEVKSVVLSQVSDLTGFCYEVINLETQDNKILSIGQTKGRIHKLNHTMTPEEKDKFNRGEFVDNTPCRREN